MVYIVYILYIVYMLYAPELHRIYVQKYPTKTGSKLKRSMDQDSIRNNIQLSKDEIKCSPL